MLNLFKNNKYIKIFIIIKISIFEKKFNYDYNNNNKKKKKF